MLNAVWDAWASLAQPTWALDPLGQASASSTCSEGSRFLSKRFDADEGSLQYKLFIPSRYEGDPMPLIVMLHGGGQNADDFALGTRMNELAEEHQCFVLYPQQSPSANWSMCWNWFDESHHHRGRGEPGALAAITRNIIAEYAVDETRVYVAGLSAGGAMAVILSRTYPELFAAVGCHSGLAHGSATDRYSALQAMTHGGEARVPAGREPAASVPIIVFHGDSDSTVHPKNSTSIVRQFLDSYVGQEGYEQLDMPASKETGQEGGRTFTRHVHQGRAGQVVAEHWTIHGAGHAWSGGSGRSSYTDADGPDASREMLRFFLQRHRTAQA